MEINEGPKISPACKSSKEDNGGRGGDNMAPTSADFLKVVGVFGEKVSVQPMWTQEVTEMPLVLFEPAP